MGIFNFFVVVPEILASLIFGYIMSHLLHNNRMLAVVAGGVCMLVAALLMQRVEDPPTIASSISSKAISLADGEERA